MSRIGKKSITIPAGVDVRIENQTVTVKGKLGEMQREFHPDIQIEREGNVISVRPSGNRSILAPALWGMTRTLVSNMIAGVSTGFSKNLEITGVGYKASVAGSELKLALGFSHDVLLPIPAGLTVEVDKNVSIVVKGADKEKIGALCAVIRSYRKPEPYKGKGVRYSFEKVLRKAGKKK
ncbi:MAG: 50S ribosomal protein L6 [Magnetococcales bacterium]|nr:50S ribosomal protein L6 [Magnetococcales bacterium]NGZ27345.1 50S ribosomal protein L6 [Magnetococcales bacterium]